MRVALEMRWVSAISVAGTREEAVRYQSGSLPGQASADAQPVQASASAKTAVMVRMRFIIS